MNSITSITTIRNVFLAKENEAVIYQCVRTEFLNRYQFDIKHIYDQYIKSMMCYIAMRASNIHQISKNIILRLNALTISFIVDGIIERNEEQIIRYVQQSRPNLNLNTFTQYDDDIPQIQNLQQNQHQPSSSLISSNQIRPQIQMQQTQMSVSLQDLQDLQLANEELHQYKFSNSLPTTSTTQNIGINQQHQSSISLADLGIILSDDNNTDIEKESQDKRGSEESQHKIPIITAPTTPKESDKNSEPKQDEKQEQKEEEEKKDKEYKEKDEEEEEEKRIEKEKKEKKINTIPRHEERHQQKQITEEIVSFNGKGPLYITYDSRLPSFVDFTMFSQITLTRVVLKYDNYTIDESISRFAVKILDKEYTFSLFPHFHRVYIDRLETLLAYIQAALNNETNFVFILSKNMETNKVTIKCNEKFKLLFQDKTCWKFIGFVSNDNDVSSSYAYEASIPCALHQPKTTTLTLGDRKLQLLLDPRQKMIDCSVQEDVNPSSLTTTNSIFTDSSFDGSYILYFKCQKALVDDPITTNSNNDHKNVIKKPTTRKFKSINTRRKI